MSEIDTLLKYIAELENQIQQHKNAMAKASEDHGFSVDSYASAHPSSSLQLEVARLVIREVAQTLEGAKALLSGLQLREKELQDEIQKYRGKNQK